MAKRGRPVKGVGLLEKLEASHVAQQRLTLILQTLAGAITVQEACAVLGINRSRFNQLRQEFLAGAAGLLEPRPAGRPSRRPSPEQLEIQRLQQQILQLQLDLKAMQVREELALVMPYVLRKRRPARAGGKNPRPVRPSAMRRGSTGSPKC
jgi:hypothetical protein